MPHQIPPLDKAALTGRVRSAKAYRAIPADTVATAMIAAAGTQRTGRYIHTYADMIAPEGIK